MQPLGTALSWAKGCVVLDGIDHHGAQHQAAEAEGQATACAETSEAAEKARAGRRAGGRRRLRGPRRATDRLRVAQRLSSTCLDRLLAATRLVQGEEAIFRELGHASVRVNHGGARAIQRNDPVTLGEGHARFRGDESLALVDHDLAVDVGQRRELDRLGLGTDGGQCKAGGLLAIAVSSSWALRPTALSLAIHFAQMGKTVLLIDADLRKASLHKKLNIANDTGLTNYLAGDAKPVEITKACRVPRVYVVPSGPLPPNPAELISSTKMVSFLNLAAEKFDQVIIDGPPVLGLADAPLLGNLSDATVLVVEAGSTSRNFARNAVKRLRATHTTLIGGILTKLDSRSNAYGYYHSYYYSDSALPDKLKSAA